MKLNDIFLTESKIPTITTGDAKNQSFFGPVYHGSTPESLAKIKQQGFRIIKGGVDQRNGYDQTPYGNTGTPPPVHHLGYGIYFTTVKSIAKKFNNNSVRGLVEYYLDVPRLETINFAAPHTMMKWWVDNGYDYHQTQDRIESTENLTNNLKSQYDAVWFKGKTLHSVLDGDQICVYDPSRIYLVDDSNALPYAIGSRVKFIDRGNDKRFNPGSVSGKIINKTPIPWDRLKSNEQFTAIYDPRYDHNYFTVKWTRGGTKYNYTERDLEPI